MAVQARTAGGKSVELLHVESPFSSFEFIETHFPGHMPIRRLFSQARSLGMQSICMEEISPVGLVEDENRNLTDLYSDYKPGELKRVTFWSERLESPKDLASANPKAFLGYAILKQDVVHSLGKSQWHVFEAVTRRNPYEHTYIPAGRMFDTNVCGHTFAVPGVLYCQQNGLNKACAQVALRSLCALHVPDENVSFSAINSAAESATGPFDPSQGLEVKQMRAVLEHFGIGYLDIDYTTLSEEERTGLVYQKFLYAGIESGAGALLGFKLTGPQATGHHIIPFFGHTFNRDLWVPNADSAYFHVGEETRYIPSESWLSSFVGHDDNFGSNYCIPRLYVTPEQAQYVVSLYRKSTCFSGVEAEAIAVNFLYSVRKSIVPSGNPWLRRFMRYVEAQQVVLRAVALTRAEYLKHLRAAEDWEGQREAAQTCQGMEAFLPEHLWMVEVSLPELFPANLRKLGEILLNASEMPAPDQDLSTYILARLPGRYFIFDGTISDGTPRFTIGPSSLTSHTALFSEAFRET